MNPILRTYQSDLIDRIFSQWQTHRRILAQLPTGGGKSVAMEKGYKAAWIRFRLEELKPPLTIWTKYAQMMEYKPGWAFYRWQEQQRGMAA
jgi:hypothetical protein